MNIKKVSSDAIDHQPIEWALLAYILSGLASIYLAATTKEGISIYVVSIIIGICLFGSILTTAVMFTDR